MSPGSSTPASSARCLLTRAMRCRCSSRSRASAAAQTRLPSAASSADIEHAHPGYDHQDRAALRLREVRRSRRPLRQSGNAESGISIRSSSARAASSAPAEYASDSNYQTTASIMKMVVNGFAGAGTIEMGGFDYHGQGRATGEDAQFQAGSCIGACLEYAAQRRRAAHGLHLQRRLAERQRHDRQHAPPAAASSCGRATIRPPPPRSSSSTTPRAGRRCCTRHRPADWLLRCEWLGGYHLQPRGEFRRAAR